MAKRNVESGKTVNGRIRSAKYPGTPGTKFYNNKNSSPSPTKNEQITQRLSPSRVHTPPQNNHSHGSSPRTSPGLLAGHYAGCKWTEPPSPSALPLPPQHWMQAPHTVMQPFHKPTSDHLDIAQQLKVLLKVHA